MASAAPSSSLHPSLPTPPFLDISGVPNFRDLGGYATDAHPGKLFRRNLIYRSSEPSKLTPEGIRKLQELGITKVYDLRSAEEIESHNAKHGGKVVEWDGAERVLLSAFVDEDYSPEALALRFSRFSGEGSKVSWFLDTATAPNHPRRPPWLGMRHGPSGPRAKEAPTSLSSSCPHALVVWNSSSLWGLLHVVKLCFAVWF